VVPGISGVAGDTGDKQYSVLLNERIAGNARCHISLLDGLTRYLAYMDQHPEFKVADPAFDQWCDDLIERGKIA